MTRLIERILKAENIEIDYIEIGKIMTHCQGDYRRLVNIANTCFTIRKHLKRLKKFGKTLIIYFQSLIKK